MGARSGERRWGAGSVETQLLEGDGRPGCDGSTDAPSDCSRSLRTRRHRICSPLPDTNATVPGLQAHSFGADTTREGAAFHSLGRWC